MPPKELFKWRRAWNRLSREDQDLTAAIWRRHVAACRAGEIDPDPAVIRETIADLRAGIKVEFEF